MATATKDIERIVRKVMSEQQDSSDKATLQAIQRLSTLLTEQVIPKLADEDSEEIEAEPEDDEAIAMSAYNAERPARRPVRPPQDEVPEEDVDEPPANGQIPPAVTEAFEDLYQTLSPEQASALASLFSAVGDELGEGGDADDSARA